MQRAFNHMESKIEFLVEILHSQGLEIFINTENNRTAIRPGNSPVLTPEFKKILGRYWTGLDAFIKGETVHDFGISVEKGSDTKNDPFFDEMYRRTFPTLDTIARTQSSASKVQKSGCDVVIILSSGREIRLDEKRRFGTFTDIALEYKHVYSGGGSADGWIEKDLAIEYLAYGIIRLKQGYIIPWIDLQKVWRKNKAEWIRNGINKEQGFFNAEAKNDGYISHSCCVPADVLMREIAGIYAVDLNHPGSAKQSQDSLF